MGEGGLVGSLTGDGEADLAGDELSDPSTLDTDLDLDFAFFRAGGEADLDFDLLPRTFGDLDLALAGGGERDLDRCLRAGERDFERFPDFGEERFLRLGERERLLTGERDGERLRDGGVLDLERFRGVLDRERRLRFNSAGERDRVRRLLRTERERERRDLGGGERLRRDTDRLLERLPLARLTGVLDLDRRAPRLGRELERRSLAGERDRERLPDAPLRLGERVRERLVPPRGREPDLRPLLGDRDREGDLRPLRFGERDTFLFGERELLWRFGDLEELLHRLGDLDFFRGFDAFFLGVGEREVERE